MPATTETSADGARDPAQATATIAGGVPPYTLVRASCAGAANVALAGDPITASPGSNSTDCGVSR